MADGMKCVMALMGPPGILVFVLCCLLLSAFATPPHLHIHRIFLLSNFSLCESTNMSLRAMLIVSASRGSHTDPRMQ